MKKGSLILLIVAIVLVVLIAVPISSYNSLVSAQENVDNQAANIKAQLQRRVDLIPNLIQVVQNYTTHETEVFTAVTEARSAMMSAKTMPEMANANSEMSAALTSLVAVAEAYPELKSDTVYVGLMDELAGTENRIAVARTDYNAAVKSYNQSIRRFPAVLIARLFGFDSADYFEASESAQSAPTVPAIS